MTGSNQSELNSLSERWRSVGGRYPRALAAILILVATGMGYAQSPDFSLKLEPLTTGPKHHLFGYIGQCQTVPWNADDQYILGMEIKRIDRMPRPEEAADIILIDILIDTKQNNKIIRIDKTHAWNPQQGTMFYWKPQKRSSSSTIAIQRPTEVYCKRLKQAEKRSFLFSVHKWCTHPKVHRNQRSCIRYNDCSYFYLFINNRF